MTPADFNISLVQGDSYAQRFPLWADAAQTVPFDTDGFSAKAQIRRSANAPVVLELSTDNGAIGFTTLVAPVPSGGSITMTLMSVDLGGSLTASLPIASMGYDLQLTNGPWTRTILRGSFTVEAQFTR